MISSFLCDKSKATLSYIDLTKTTNAQIDIPSVELYGFTLGQIFKDKIYTMKPWFKKKDIITRRGFRGGYPSYAYSNDVSIAVDSLFPEIDGEGEIIEWVLNEDGSAYIQNQTGFVYTAKNELAITRWKAELPNIIELLPGDLGYPQDPATVNTYYIGAEQEQYYISPNIMGQFI